MQVAGKQELSICDSCPTLTVANLPDGKPGHQVKQWLTQWSERLKISCQVFSNSTGQRAIWGRQKASVINCYLSAKDSHCHLHVKLCLLQKTDVPKEAQDDMWWFCCSSVDVGTHISLSLEKPHSFICFPSTFPPTYSHHLLRNQVKSKYTGKEDCIQGSK